MTCDGINGSVGILPTNMRNSWYARQINHRDSFRVRYGRQVLTALVATLTKDPLCNGEVALTREYQFEKSNGIVNK